MGLRRSSVAFDEGVETLDMSCIKLSRLPIVFRAVVLGLRLLEGRSICAQVMLEVCMYGQIG